jgi:hypothetical protein
MLYRLNATVYFPNYSCFLSPVIIKPRGRVKCKTRPRLLHMSRAGNRTAVQCTYKLWKPISIYCFLYKYNGIFSYSQLLSASDANITQRTCIVNYKACLGSYKYDLELGIEPRRTLSLVRLYQPVGYQPVEVAIENLY